MVQTDQSAVRQICWALVATHSARYVKLCPSTKQELLSNIAEGGIYF